MSRPDPSRGDPQPQPQGQAEVGAPLPDFHAAGWDHGLAIGGEPMSGDEGGVGVTPGRALASHPAVAVQPGAARNDHTAPCGGAGALGESGVCDPCYGGQGNPPMDRRDVSPGLDPAGVFLDPSALARLMPMHMLLCQEARLRAVGPTVHKLFNGCDLLNRTLFECFDLRGPSPIRDAPALWAAAGQMLHLRPRGLGVDLRMRGLAVRLGTGQAAGGGLINLSFGIDIIRAVGPFRLSAPDFASTDMAMELLYLAEANRLVTDEMRALGVRLDAARQRAEEEALSDPLTGLRNRRACDSMLLRLCQEEAGFAVLHLDLDHFKQVNDRLGHAAGDLVLRAVAETLRLHCRAMDCIARVGGDEFILLLPGLSSPGRLRALGQALIDQIAQPILYEGQPCLVSTSIGALIAAAGQTHDPAEILRIADAALYTAKKRGRDQLFLASY